MHSAKPSTQRRTGFEKMQMSHARLRKDLARMQAERAKSAESGKPVHLVQGRRR